MVYDTFLSPNIMSTDMPGAEKKNASNVYERFDRDIREPIEELVRQFSSRAPGIHTPGDAAMIFYCRKDLDFTPCAKVFLAALNSDAACSVEGLINIFIRLLRIELGQHIEAFDLHGGGCSLGENAAHCVLSAVIELYRQPAKTDSVGAISSATASAVGQLRAAP